MTAPLTYFNVLSLLVISWLLSACHSSSNTPTEIPEINTLHIYTADQKIYSFNEETGISTLRGEYNTGQNQYLLLNTDDTKQGYEYAVFANNNDINLLNLDKATNGQKFTLATISRNFKICGLFPYKSASKFSFDDAKASNRSAIDLPIMTIEYQKVESDCNLNSNLRDELNFNSILVDPKDLNGIKRTLGKKELIYGGVVTNFAAKIEKVELNPSRYNDSGFLGHDFTGNRLVFNYLTEKKVNQWETPFYSSDVESVRQASKEHVVVTKENEIYVLKSNELFDINKENDSTPVQERLDNLFTKSTLEFDYSNAIEFNARQNESNFLIKLDNTLHYFESPKFKQIPTNESLESQNATKTEFDLTSDKITIVLQEANDIQTLLAIVSSSGQATTLVSASKIQFKVIGSNIFVNTLNAQDHTGWQAHLFYRLNNVFVSKYHDNSQFVFSKDRRNTEDSIFLLSATESSTDNKLIGPTLLEVDINEQNGKRKGRNDSNQIVDFKFGILNTDVESILSSEIINDIYGMIRIKGTNGDTGSGLAVEEVYYFNPSQIKAEPSINEQSLKLMYRKVL